MRVFWPEVERVITVVLVGAVVGAFALALAWGYRQHAEARTWRAAACTYRLREVVRQTNSLLVVTPKDGADCATLARLGFTVGVP